jgi:exodeoxyribonuclease VIII
MSTIDTARDGLVYGMKDVEYHAGPELSSTGARAILDSPARFRYDLDHPRASAAFDVGTAAHSKILGVGAGIIAYPPEHLTPSGNVSEKAATKQWAAEQRAAGLVPVSPAEVATVDAMAEAVLAHRAARRVLEYPNGGREVSAFATDPETGVRCRARFDVLNPDGAADLKTTAGSASRAGFGREAARYGYPVQEAFYLDVLSWLDRSSADNLPMRWIVVEKRPPHLVAVHEFPELVRMFARDLAAEARRTYAECKATDTWPGYGDDVIETDIPAWWFAANDDIEEMEVA